MDSKQDIINYVNDNYEGEEKRQMMEFCNGIFQLMEEGSEEDKADIMSACEKRLKELEISDNND